MLSAKHEFRRQEQVEETNRLQHYFFTQKEDSQLLCMREKVKVKLGSETISSLTENI